MSWCLGALVPWCLAAAAAAARGGSGGVVGW